MRFNALFSSFNCYIMALNFLESFQDSAIDMLKNNSKGYGLVSILLHWLSLFIVVGLFAVGLWMVDLSYYSEWYQTAPHWHKSVGILFALAIIFRLCWNLFQTHPTAIGSDFVKLAAKIAHSFLYLLLFALFISGYLISTADSRGIAVFDWFNVPGFGSLFENQEDLAGLIHEWLAYSLIGLAVLHGAAAIKHHFADKDDTLKRMLSTRIQKL